MKIIHTGDWHIGKIVNEFSMIEDQKFYLDRLIELLEEERPDAFIIAGDIYDRSVPPAEAVELLDNVLSKIILENFENIMKLKDRGINLFFTDVDKIKKQMLDELENSKNS